MKAPQAARWAVKIGYKNVYVYHEGLKGWTEAGHPLQVAEKIPDFKIPAIVPAQLNAMIEKDPSLTVVDIRDDDLFQAIPFKAANGRHHVRMVDLDSGFASISRDLPLVVVDHMGNQASFAGAFLKGKKLNVVGFLEGGVMGWKNAGLPLAR